MTRKLLAGLACALMLSAAPGFALDQARTEAAERYAALPAVQAMMDDMLSARSLAGQIMNSVPGGTEISDTQLSRLSAVLADVLMDLRPELETTMITNTAALFTLDEILALTAFYDSEHGAAIMAKMQPFMQETMSHLSPKIMSRVQAVTPEIIKIMQEK